MADDPPDWINCPLCSDANARHPMSDFSRCPFKNNLAALELGRSNCAGPFKLLQQGFMQARIDLVVASSIVSHTAHTPSTTTQTQTKTQTQHQHLALPPPPDVDIHPKPKDHFNLNMADTSTDQYALSSTTTPSPPTGPTTNTGGNLEYSQLKLPFNSDPNLVNLVHLFNNILARQIPSTQEFKPITSHTQVNFRVETLFNKNSVTFMLSSDFMYDSGLPESKLLLYCRQNFHQQFDFLQNEVLKDGVLGCIVGPPGTGKSTTTLSFISTVPTDIWTITWIHLSRTQSPFILRFHKRSKTKITLSVSKMLEQMEDCLAQVENDHIVLLDGFVDSEMHHSHFQKICHSWYRDRTDAKYRKRFIIICSMSSRSKNYNVEDCMNNLKEFLVPSWTLDEYESAIRNPDFFEYVTLKRKSISSAIEDEMKHDEWIKYKYYYAGGSSRNMFFFSLESVIRILSDGVDTVSNAQNYIKGSIGSRSSDVVNRLFGYHIVDGEKRMTFMSQYVATKLAIKVGRELISHLFNASQLYSNPAMNGWYFEMWIFECLKNGGLTLYSKKNESNAEKWSESPRIEYMDLKKLSKICDDEQWWKPVYWNQGGFDAVYTHKKEKMIRFVQMTIGKSHSLRIDYIHKFLNDLMECGLGYEILTLEIVFLVDKRKLDSFQISEVRGLGLLAAFRNWRKFQEKEQIQIYGVEAGWITL